MLINKNKIVKRVLSTSLSAGVFVASGVGDHRTFLKASAVKKVLSNKTKGKNASRSLKKTRDMLEQQCEQTVPSNYREPLKKRKEFTPFIKPLVKKPNQQDVELKQLKKVQTSKHGKNASGLLKEIRDMVLEQQCEQTVPRGLDNGPEENPKASAEPSNEKSQKTEQEENIQIQETSKQTVPAVEGNSNDQEIEYECGYLKEKFGKLVDRKYNKQLKIIKGNIETGKPPLEGIIEKLKDHLSESKYFSNKENSKKVNKQRLIEEASKQCKLLKEKIKKENNAVINKQLEKIKKNIKKDDESVFKDVDPLIVKGLSCEGSLHTLNRKRVDSFLERSSSVNLHEIKKEDIVRLLDSIESFINSIEICNKIKYFKKADEYLKQEEKLKNLKSRLLLEEAFKPLSSSKKDFKKAFEAFLWILNNSKSEEEQQSLHDEFDKALEKSITGPSDYLNFLNDAYELGNNDLRKLVSSLERFKNKLYECSTDIDSSEISSEEAAKTIEILLMHKKPINIDEYFKQKNKLKNLKSRLIEEAFNPLSSSKKDFKKAYEAFLRILNNSKSKEEQQSLHDEFDEALEKSITGPSDCLNFLNDAYELGNNDLRKLVSSLKRLKNKLYECSTGIDSSKISSEEAAKTIEILLMHEKLANEDNNLVRFILGLGDLSRFSKKNAPNAFDFIVYDSNINRDIRSYKYLFLLQTSVKFDKENKELYFDVSGVNSANSFPILFLKCMSVEYCKSDWRSAFYKPGFFSNSSKYQSKINCKSTFKNAHYAKEYILDSFYYLNPYEGEAGKNKFIEDRKKFIKSLADMYKTYPDEFFYAIKNPKKSSLAIDVLSELTSREIFTEKKDKIIFITDLLPEIFHINAQSEKEDICALVETLYEIAKEISSKESVSEFEILYDLLLCLQRKKPLLSCCAAHYISKNRRDIMDGTRPYVGRECYYSDYCDCYSYDNVRLAGDYVEALAILNENYYNGKTSPLKNIIPEFIGRSTIHEFKDFFNVEPVVKDEKETRFSARSPIILCKMAVLYQDLDATMNRFSKEIESMSVKKSFEELENYKKPFEKLKKYKCSGNFIEMEYSLDSFTEYINEETQINKEDYFKTKIKELFCDGKFNAEFDNIELDLDAFECELDAAIEAKSLLVKSVLDYN